MVCDVHEIDTDSKLIRWLDLKPLSKSPRVYQGQLPPAMCSYTFVVRLVLRESSGKVSSLLGPNRQICGDVKGGLCIVQV